MTSTKGLLIFGAVFAEEIGGEEVVVSSCPFAAVESCQRVVFLGEPGEAELAAGDPGWLSEASDTGDATGPEEVPVGVDEPPASLVFDNTEASGGRELGASQPATKPVSVC